MILKRVDRLDGKISYATGGDAQAWVERVAKAMQVSAWKARERLQRGEILESCAYLYQEVQG